MKKIHILFEIGALALATSLAACGEDNSSSGPGDQASSQVSSVESEYDLPNCTDSRDGTVRFVRGTKEGFVCQGGRWVYYNQLADVEDDLPGCIDSRNNQVAYLYEENRAMECRYGVWEEYSLSTELSSSSVMSSSSTKSSSSLSLDSDSLSSSCDADSSSSSSSVELESSNSSARSSSSVASSSSRAKSSSSSAKSSSSVVSSSSSVKSSCSSAISYGSLTDSRDGKEYRTVTIGTQTWMAENLNYADSIKSPSLKGKSWCYYNQTGHYCDEYGRLYTWAAAIDSVSLVNDAENPQICGYRDECSLPAVVQGVCPDGWHLPTKDEWEILFAAAGGKAVAGKMLKSTSGWYGGHNGTNAYGFSALPAGYRINIGGFNDTGNDAYFWSASQYEDDSDSAYLMLLINDRDAAYLSLNDKYSGYSVRCLRDTPDQSVISISSSSSERRFGALTDSRDGKVYKTVTIGTQTWMAKNLNYADSIKTPSLKGKSWCYKNDSDNCDEYGRLYTWAAAIDSVSLANDAEIPQICGYGEDCTLPDVVQGVCPDGWHLPTKDEWETLFAAVGGKDVAGKMLKFTSGWNGGRNGTHAYGFSALPAGLRSNDGNFNKAGDFALFWSASQRELNSNYAYYMFLRYLDDYAYLFSDAKNDSYSVRCLQN